MKFLEMLLKIKEIYANKCIFDKDNNKGKTMYIVMTTNTQQPMPHDNNNDQGANVY
jgi:hypothetical protein